MFHSRSCTNPVNQKNSSSCNIGKYSSKSKYKCSYADKVLTNWQDSVPDCLQKTSRQVVICIYRQRTN